MSNANKIKTVTLVLLLVTLYAILMATETEHASTLKQLQSTTNQSSAIDNSDQQFAPQPLAQVQVDKTTESKVTEATQIAEKTLINPNSTPEEKDCNVMQQNIPLPVEEELKELVSKFSRHQFAFESSNEYTDQSEENLLILADSGDADAMFVLGVSYLWMAFTQEFNPHYSIAPPNVDHEQAPTVDTLYLDKALHWFNLSVMHGYVTVIEDTISVYNIFVKRQLAHDYVANQDQLEAYVKAAFKFSEWAQPESRILSMGTLSDTSKLTTEQLEYFHYYLNDLKHKWTNFRELNNLPLTVETQKTKEAEQFLNELAECFESN